MSFPGFFNNLIEVRITSADMDSVYDLVLREGFSLYSVSRLDEFTTCFTIRREDFNRLQDRINARGEEVSVNKKTGIYWTIKRFAKRPVIYIISLIIVVLTVFVPTRVLFFKVIGNSAVSERRIIDAASQCGIEFGASRRLIRNENFKNRMLSMIPEIEWAGVNTIGCVAEISVREKNENSEKTEEYPSNIIAARDAVISSIVVSKGSSHCAVGEAVLKGQLLISGYTDCGKALLQGRAEGEIYGYTSRELNAVTPLVICKKTNMVKQEYRYSILIGKKRINLWKGSGICTATCDRIYQEYWIQLPGGYTLPICLIRESIQYYDVTESSAESGEDAILSSMYLYLQEHMAAGSILHQEVRFSQGDGILEASGFFGCHELIGQQKSEELGETYG